MSKKTIHTFGYSDQNNVFYWSIQIYVALPNFNPTSKKFIVRLNDFDNDLPAKKSEREKAIVLKTYQQQQAIDLVADYIVAKDLGELAVAAFDLIGQWHNFEFSKENYNEDLEAEKGVTLPNFTLLKTLIL